jgi:hypothetical protein
MMIFHILVLDLDLKLQNQGEQEGAKLQKNKAKKEYQQNL